MRGLLNAGHRRGSEVVRMVGLGTAMRARRFPVFCAKAIAGIGTLPDTIADRSIEVRLKRRRRGERVARFRMREVAPAGLALRLGAATGRVSRTSTRCATRGRTCRTNSTTGHRTDGSRCSRSPTWRVTSGRRGLGRRRSCCRTGRDDAAGSRGAQLLADVRRVFDAAGVNRMTSAALCDALNAIEDAPWGGWREGKGIDARNLARRLRDTTSRPRSSACRTAPPPGLPAREVRRLVGALLPPGRHRENGRCACLPPSYPQHRNNRDGTGISGKPDPQQDPSCCGSENGEIPHGYGDVADVADRNGGTGARAVSGGAAGGRGGAGRRTSRGAVRRVRDEGRAGPGEPRCPSGGRCPGPAADDLDRWTRRAAGGDS